ncbi:MAG: protein translocase subunit SecF [Lysobacterales bacterium]
MEIFNPKANLPFLSWRKVSVTLSIVLMVASLALLLTRGLNFSLDFTGGTLIEVRFAEPVAAADVREPLEAAGYSNFVVQSLGGTTEWSIRIGPQEGQDQADQVAQQVLSVLQTRHADASVNRSDFVGPQVGKELAEDGVVAVTFVVIGIMIYIALRFQWKFGLAAIAGEVHDVLITLGLLSLFQTEFDLTVMAAVLTVAGYSINDKVVVFDRVREVFRQARKQDPEAVLDKAINNTMSRTIITGITTALALFALLILGGPVTYGFAETVLFGIAIGTLSTVFFCAPILLWLKTSKLDLVVSKSEDDALAARP